MSTEISAGTASVFEVDSTGMFEVTDPTVLDQVAGGILVVNMVCGCNIECKLP